MYVVYNQVQTPDGTTERQLVTYWNPDEVGPVAAEKVPGCRYVHDVTRWRTESAKMNVEDMLCDDEDAFCLPDGRMLVFCP